MAPDDIEKLKEKVAKDPNSKLFVPLAEEYKKRGMIDEAVSVLTEGLNSQPGYMSARVALGKIYLEKNMTAEAKEEFEKVVSAVQDNLFAHKKLAEIYRDMGDKARAITAYKTVLKLNSLDEDAVSNLEALQSSDRSAASHGIEDNKEAPQYGFGEIPGMGVVPPLEADQAEEASEAEEVEIVAPEEPPLTAHEDEFEKFKQSISGRDEGIKESALVEAGEDIPEEEAVGEAVISEDEIQEAEKEILSYVDKAASSSGGADVATPQKEKPLRQEEKSASASNEADTFVAEGNYLKAMMIYKKMLSANPQDKHLLQKVEELKMLLKMLGKGEDMVISRLEAFREGIRKRENELLRSA